MEFLTNLVTNVPAGTPDATVEEVKAAEAKRVGQLAAEGQLRQILASLPLHIWMTVEITPLRPHHNDPVGRAQ
jgi:muconolactone D-isomerase